MEDNFSEADRLWGILCPDRAGDDRRSAGTGVARGHLAFVWSGAEGEVTPRVSLNGAPLPIRMVESGGRALAELPLGVGDNHLTWSIEGRGGELKLAVYLRAGELLRKLAEEDAVRSVPANGSVPPRCLSGCTVVRSVSGRAPDLGCAFVVHGHR